jgi:peroxiredoxin
VKPLAAGDPAPPFRLPTAAGGTLDTRALLGRHWLLSFHRYAT